MRQKNKPTESQVKDHLHKLEDRLQELTTEWDTLETHLHEVVAKVPREGKSGAKLNAKAMAAKDHACTPPVIAKASRKIETQKLATEWVEGIREVLGAELKNAKTVMDHAYSTPVIVKAPREKLKGASCAVCGARTICEKGETFFRLCSRCKAVSDPPISDARNKINPNNHHRNRQDPSGRQMHTCIAESRSLLADSREPLPLEQEEENQEERTDHTGDSRDCREAASDRRRQSAGATDSHSSLTQSTAVRRRGSPTLGTNHTVDSPDCREEFHKPARDQRRQRRALAAVEEGADQDESSQPSDTMGYSRDYGEAFFQVPTRDQLREKSSLAAVEEDDDDEDHDETSQSDTMDDSWTPPSVIYTGEKGTHGAYRRRPEKAASVRRRGKPTSSKMPTMMSEDKAHGCVGRSGKTKTQEDAEAATAYLLSMCAVFAFLLTL